MVFNVRNSLPTVLEVISFQITEINKAATVYSVFLYKIIFNEEYPRISWNLNLVQ